MLLSVPRLFVSLLLTVLAGCGDANPERGSHVLVGEYRLDEEEYSRLLLEASIARLSKDGDRHVSGVEKRYWHDRLRELIGKSLENGSWYLNLSQDGAFTLRTPMQPREYRGKWMKRGASVEVVVTEEDGRARSQSYSELLIGKEGRLLITHWHEWRLDQRPVPLVRVVPNQ
jgi:hypothetical protein